MKCTVKTTRTSPSFGPFSIFVGLRRPLLAAVGLCGPLWISCTFRKNTFKKNSYLWPKRRVTSFGPFSLFVSLLFPLRRPLLAAVGLCGPSWLLSVPKRGVVGG